MRYISVIQIKNNSWRVVDIALLITGRVELQNKNASKFQYLLAFYCFNCYINVVMKIILSETRIIFLTQKIVQIESYLLF